MPKYRDIIFLDDSADFDKWYVEFDENPEDGLSYLLRWEYGDDMPENDKPSWGNGDTLVEFIRSGLHYTIAYNWHLSYVSLTEVLA